MTSATGHFESASAAKPRCGATFRRFTVAAALWVAAALPALGVETAGEVTERMLTSKSMLGEAATNRAPIEIFQRISAVARELRGPDGIAREEASGNLYVSEENASTVIRIKPNGSKQTIIDDETPIYEGEDVARQRVPELRFPEGLALDGKGLLYAVEDVPGGRLISFNLAAKPGKTGLRGNVVPLPIENSRFAWEAVDARPSGELLIAGSTMEDFLNGRGKEGLFGAFRGAVLYRDVHGDWWSLLNHAMASYSAACFSADGNYAFYACEISGEVGCLDLRTHYLRTYRAPKPFHAPEGLCALPGGSALVVEEGGKIYRLDPTSDAIQLIHETSDTLESACWDGARHRVLVTDDQKGDLLSLELKAGLDFSGARGTVQDIPFKEESTPVEMIPDQCPEYLAQVLKLGGYDAYRKDGPLGFKTFAKKYCLIAIDAEARLGNNHKPVEDPITKIQFMIVAPYLIGYKDGDLIWSSSGFTVVKQSGQAVKTGLVKRQIIHGDLMESRFTPVGGQTIALPMPFSARVNTDGYVSVNFMGMGVTPDFYLVLDTVDPNKSVMVVIQPDGFVQQYEIHLPPHRDRSHWVVALERKDPDVWRNLSAKR